MSTLKLPPQNIQAEESVLGALLLDHDAIVAVAEILKPEFFYKDIHNYIYKAIIELYAERSPIDIVTVSNQLKKNKQLKEVGGTVYLSSLAEAVPTSSHVRQYAKIVKDLYTKRRLIRLSADLNELAFDEGRPTEEILDKAESEVFSLSQTHIEKGFIHIKDILAESFDRLDELQKNAGGLRGVPTGFADLDDTLSGMQKSNLLILAARPGVGKTAFSLNIAMQTSIMYKKKVAYFSLEMSKEELVDRLLVSQADIDAWRLKTGRLSEDDFTKLSDAMGVLADAKIFIDDTPGISVLELRTKARRLMAEHGIDFIVVDYLQLMHGSGIYRDNRVLEIGEISMGLKNIARELKVPVLSLAQLSRAVESRGTKQPQLSDLRESGCIPGDSLIYLPDTGKYEKIENMEGKAHFRVLAFNPSTYALQPEKVEKVFCTGIKNVSTLTTRLGKEIRATANHKFYTLMGWKRLDELSVGEHIALPRHLPATHTNVSFSLSEAALLGHLIGDGCTLPRHAIQYTTKELELAEMVSNLATDVFGEQVKPRITKEKNHKWYQVFLSASFRLTHGKQNPVAKWLRDMNIFGLRSYEKIIPDELYAQPNEVIATFLRHLWATDGCIHIGKASELKYPKIYYASSSQKLAQGVIRLLLRFGIQGILKAIPQKNGRAQYHVIVSGISDTVLFGEHIKAAGQARTKRLAAILAFLSLAKENTNRDVIPFGIWRGLIVPQMQEKKMSSRALQAAIGMQYCGTSLYTQNINRVRARRIGDALDSNSVRQLASSEVYWDSITSIIPGKPTKVYDLTVPTLHNFVANDIVVHNSIEQDADVVMFLYREDDDERENVKLGIAKHRNGALRVIDLYFRGDRVRFFGVERKQSIAPAM